ncbi:ABC transporter permease [Bacteroides fragilis]|uniref:ABC transporter permease n=1 Tax=Bacteroides fragilis TaxID=817 RepID=UPI001899F317|nr:ABC transporter permease [Bacteroides fragilis]
MIKQYFKQSLVLLQQNKLLSVIAIIGTALAIAMIMCIVLIYQARTANYEPEINRDRTLSIEMTIAQKIDDKGWNMGNQLSLRTIKECFYPMTTAEAVSAVHYSMTSLAATPDGTREVKCAVSYTDDNFWRVFGFRFLHGKPYGQEFVSGEKKLVVTRSLARRLFGIDNAVGRIISLGFVDYTVCGVVADVSVLAEAAYAEAWAPYTALPDYERSVSEGLQGGYSCYILVPKGGDPDVVRAEARQNVDRMNANQKELKLLLGGAPDTRLMSLARDNPFDDPDTSRLVLIYIVVITILLLVPAINLSGITLSRMRRRMEEIGVRRAFGATRGELLRQVLAENLVVTLMGGVLGLILSYIAVLCIRDWLLNTSMSGYYGVDTQVSAGMVIQPFVFVCALLFCLLMNLLSAGIPAIRVSRSNIVNAIK